MSVTIAGVFLIGLGLGLGLGAGVGYFHGLTERLAPLTGRPVPRYRRAPNDVVSPE